MDFLKRASSREDVEGAMLDDGWARSERRSERERGEAAAAAAVEGGISSVDRCADVDPESPDSVRSRDQPGRKG